MKFCSVCNGERLITHSHGTCSVNCRREYDRRYRARAVMAKCSRCGDWRYTYYNQYARVLKTRNGACEYCIAGENKSAAEYIEVPETEDDDDIEFKPLACVDCKHGKVENASFTGYSCSLNAVFCQPRLAQRLYERS